jgi:hypothetical protein
MDSLNSHFLRLSPTRSRYVSGDGQSALVDKLWVSPSRSCLPRSTSLSSGDSTIGPKPQFWDGSLTPSQHPTTPHTAQRTFTPRRDQIVICGQYNICSETLSCRDYVIVKWGNTCYVTTRHKARCLLNSRRTVRSRAQLWPNDHGTQDEYSEMVLTLGVGNSWAAIAALEYALRYLGRRHP